MATPVLSSPLRPAPRPPSGPSSSPAPPPPSMPSPEPPSSSSSSSSSSYSNSSPSPSRFPARPPPPSPSGEIQRPRPPAPPPPTRQHLPEGHSEDAPDEDEASFLATLTLTSFKPQQQQHHQHHQQQNQPQEGESNPPSLTDLSSSSSASSSPCSIDEQHPKTPTSPIEMRHHGKSSPMLPPRGALRYEPAAALPSPAESGDGGDGLAPPPVAPRKRSVAPALAGTGGGGGGGESKNSEHRRKIVEELVQTERIYIDRMGIIITVYMEPLVQDTKWSILPAGAVGQLFSNIEAIRQFHESLYSILAEERFANWSEQQKIGDVFVQMSPYLKLYLQYCNNYDSAMSLLIQLKKKLPALEKHLTDQRDHPACTDRMQLEHLLISPVQRIPRYVLLLRDLLKNTSEDHPDFLTITKAIEHVQVIASSLDKRIADVEKANLVLEIQANITGCPETLVHPSRYLVREGVVSLCRFETSSISQATAHSKVNFYLFNDALLAASAKNLRFKGMVLFSDTTSLLRDLADSETLQNAFYVVSQDVNWTVKCTSLLEKTGWLVDIQTEIEKCRTKMRSRGQTSAGTEDRKVSTQIISTEQVKPKGESEYTVYHVHTTVSSAGTTVIYQSARRFREFFDLHAHIKKHFPTHKFSPLPAKKALGTLSSKTIENRRIMLEVILNEYLAKSDVSQDEGLTRFLELPIPDVPESPEASSSTHPESSHAPSSRSTGPVSQLSFDLGELRNAQQRRRVGDQQ